MKSLASITLGLVLMLLATGPVLAQLDELKNSTPEERAGMLTEMMQSSLSLDDKTVSSVSEINLKYAKKTQALADSSSPKFKKLMTFRGDSQAKDAELKNVLTPAQFSQYEQKQSEMRETVKQKLMEKHQAKQ